MQSKKKTDWQQVPDGWGCMEKLRRASCVLSGQTSALIQTTNERQRSKPSAADGRLEQNRTAFGASTQQI